MITQKKEPEFPQAQSTTAQISGCLPEPKITKLKTPFGKSIVSNDRKIVALVLEQNGCVKSIDWTYNSLTKRHMARWLNEEQNLCVDVFESDEGKLKISMHHSRQWVSPHDSLTPRYSKTIAFALQAAGVRCKYKQSSLQKYEGDKHEG
jgi:hypothetical protein